jgi:hypothetical protein
LRQNCDIQSPALEITDDSNPSGYRTPMAGSTERNRTGQSSLLPL